MSAPSDFETLGSSIHLLGIGGTGMSALAHILLDMGVTVSGSDRASSVASGQLADRGATVHIGHDAANLTTDGPGRVEQVFASTAVDESNPEIVAARGAGVPVGRRSDLLRILTGLVPTIAVSGTHGKTTTSAMCATAMSALGPTSFLVGSPVANLGTTARWVDGASVFVVEADESDRTHLALVRSAAIVTNVEAEHLDRYGTLGSVVDGFVEFVAETAGPVAMCADDPGASLIARYVTSGSGVGGSAAARIAPYRVAEASGARPDDAAAQVAVAEQVVLGPFGSTFVLRLGDRAIDVALSVPGAHNVANATGVLTVIDGLGLDVETAAAALVEFTGTARRFERRGEIGGVLLIDDYAHHPTELVATLAAARQLGRRVVAVFQPHLYSRTRQHATAFGDALAAADVAIVADVYGAREEPVEGVTGQLIVDRLRSLGGTPAANAVFVADRADLARAVSEIVTPGDVCLCMGAGDITTLPGELASFLSDGR